MLGHADCEWVPRCAANSLAWSQTVAHIALDTHQELCLGLKARLLDGHHVAVEGCSRGA